ncbi:MAG: NADH-quinone oxidoreductase subunit L [Nitrospiraceae bacterium]|nr:NADH-quinone oxidoreductase subunit L [Nitrospiraceae bacterium]
MTDLLWLIPFMPIAGFTVLVLAGSRLPRSVTGTIGTGTVGLSAVVSMLLAAGFGVKGDGYVVTQTLWQWLSVGDFSPRFSLYLDALSLVMVLVITCVGFLIHLYSIGFMKNEEGYSRFFAYMNLFVGSMLVLVLADNLVSLYLGWEGVGLCSYLLIGFWYRDSANGYAARKAFVITRVGDTALAVGLFLLFTNLGTLQIQELMQRAQAEWPAGSKIAVIAAALLLAGAIGKSAQLPLQTWLPDAMAGPTPVSALIHAATMVTAGVYLIARTHVLFTLAPPVQSAIAIIGAATLLLAGLSAFVQRDIKRVLAYSTISQIGYMFLALGVGAWSAALFHFMTHAFFKALLFLGAGAVILAMDHEHDIFKMGGLRSRMPVTFWTFLIGVASLSALPFVTSGFYSKDLILKLAWSSERGSVWLWAAGVAGAFITSLYAFRLLFVVFFGDRLTRAKSDPGISMTAPLVVLAALSVAAGLAALPEPASGRQAIQQFLSGVLPAAHIRDERTPELFLLLIASCASIGGMLAAWLLYVLFPRYAEGLVQTRAGRSVHRLLFTGWGFDRIYDRLFAGPFLWLTRINRDDFIDLVYEGAAWYSGVFHHLLGLTQTGKVRWYAFGIGLGAIITIGIAVFL